MWCGTQTLVQPFGRKLGPEELAHRLAVRRGLADLGDLLRRLPGRRRHHRRTDRGADEADEAVHPQHVRRDLAAVLPHLIDLRLAPYLQLRDREGARVQGPAGTDRDRGAERERPDRLGLDDDLQAELRRHRARVEIALDRFDLVPRHDNKVGAGHGDRLAGRRQPAERPVVRAVHHPLGRGRILAGLRNPDDVEMQIGKHLPQPLGRRNALDLAGADDRAGASAVLVLERPFQHVGDDLHVPMPVGVEAVARRDAVIVDHAQRPEAHIVGVEVLPERERVTAVKPAEIGMPAILGQPKRDHCGPSTRPAAPGPASSRPPRALSPRRSRGSPRDRR